MKLTYNVAPSDRRGQSRIQFIALVFAHYLFAHQHYDGGRVWYFEFRE